MVLTAAHPRLVGRLVEQQHVPVHQDEGEAGGRSEGDGLWVVYYPSARPLTRAEVSRVVALRHTQCSTDGRNETRTAEYLSQIVFRGLRAIGLPHRSLMVDGDESVHPYTRRRTASSEH